MLRSNTAVDHVFGRCVVNPYMVLSTGRKTVVLFCNSMPHGNPRHRAAECAALAFLLWPADRPRDFPSSLSAVI